jgi:hypothetical protein
MEKFKARLKNLWKSKSVWLGAVVLPATLELLQYAQNNLELVKENLGASYLTVSFFLGGAIIFVRMITTKDLAEK